MAQLKVVPGSAGFHRKLQLFSIGLRMVNAAVLLLFLHQQGVGFPFAGWQAFVPDGLRARADEQWDQIVRAFCRRRCRAGSNRRRGFEDKMSESGFMGFPVSEE